MRVRITWRRALAVAAVLAVAGFAFWWIAPYNIAARVPHWPPVRALLHSYMNNAVRSHSQGARPPAYLHPDDPAVIRLGAGHFLTGCATCHGSPERRPSPITGMMQPHPPELSGTRPRPLRELYWLTYNGLKYTGMPGWAGAGREDEAWAVAAFLARLPGMDAATFRELAHGGLLPPAADAEEGAAIAFGQPTGPLATEQSCARCHGLDGRGRDGTAPRLAGQSPAHLRRALDLYAGDRRQSGIMEPIAAALTPPEREALARHFAGLPGNWPASPAAIPGDPQRGAMLAARGDSSRGIGACRGCHGQPGNAAPRIEGQHGRFLAAWLHLWREGPQTPGPEAARMAAAVRGLTDRDIADLAAHFAHAADGRPALP